MDLQTVADMQGIAEAMLALGVLLGVLLSVVVYLAVMNMRREP